MLIDGLSLKNYTALQELHGVKFNPINKILIRKLLHARPVSGHKGVFGHALIIAGSEGTYGAAILSSMAALKAGCGLITACVPQNALIPLLSHLPEAMTKIRKGPQDVRNLDLEIYDAIGFGPGIGTGPESTEILLYLLKNYKGSLVIDADGLTILSRNKQMYELLGANTILTPHPGEFGRLTVTDSSKNDMVNAQLNFYRKYPSVILIKGRNTTVVNDKGLFYNTSGNNGMATAGSGDVLTGIITSLCAQDYTPGDAATIGTFLHGFAGDTAASENSMHSMVASDIIEGMKSFFKKFETKLS